MEISVVVGIIGCIISVAAFYIGRKTAAKDDGKEYGILLSDVGYIKGTVESMKSKIEQIDEKYNEIKVQYTVLDSKVDMYHRSDNK